MILTHWGRMTHICVGEQTIIGSDNGLSPDRRQAIIWTNAGILSTGPLGTNFSEISIEIYTFSFKKCIWNVAWKMAAILPRPQWVNENCNEEDDNKDDDTNDNDNNSYMYRNNDDVFVNSAWPPSTNAFINFPTSIYSVLISISNNIHTPIHWAAMLYKSRTIYAHC